MDEEIDDTLLAKYLAGECSEREVQLVHEWVSREPGAAERMAQLQRTWDATKDASSQWDAQDAWETVHRRIREEDPAPGSTTDCPSRDRSAKRPRRKRAGRSSRRHLIRTASMGIAVVVLALLATLLAEPNFLGLTEAGAKVFTADKGQQSTVRLTDGTKVRLNVDSRLTVSEGFETGRRKVTLEGEAYFEVARDTSRPFIVHTKNTSIQVLGTAFNVQSYASTEETRVAVSKGKVEVRTRLSNDRDAQRQDTAAVLLPRSLALISVHGMEAIRKGVDLSRELAWTNENLVFQDTPFDEVVRKLERWYDVQVDVAVSTEEIVGLNATFEDAALQEVLRNISTALDLEYRRDGRSVTFYR